MGRCCMDTDKRGVIVNKQRAQQINDFSGIRFGNITPTDIDGLIEYHDTVWLIFEVKYRGTQLPFGQRLALERMVDAFTSAGKKAMALVVDHEVDDTSESINVSVCLVREIYHSDNMLWKPPNREITLGEMAKAYIGHYAIKQTA